MQPVLRSAALAAAVVIPFCAAGIPASAQISLAAKQVYESAHVVPTNIPGITTFRAPPRGFDAVHAADTELALYGLPPRPDPQNDPDSYAKWQRAMSRLGRPATGPLKDMHVTSRNARLVRPAIAGPAGTPSTSTSGNWSGIVNTVPGLTAWNSKKSFYYVVSEFNVPVAEQAFASGGGYVCDGNWDLEVSWNGIDGFGNGDVLQGGSYSGAYCNGGSNSTYYCGWVEWFPSYNIICEFAVNPGDDIYVETYDTSSTNGYVFIDDLTLGISQSVNLQPTTTPYLVGNTAEYIVERPCCLNGNYYPLANYVKDYWADSYAYTFARSASGKPTTEVPGSLASSTYLVTMVDDSGANDISAPLAQGKYGIAFNDEGCANFLGCTP